jgi:hypothetical protein
MAKGQGRLAAIYDLFRPFDVISVAETIALKEASYFPAVWFKSLKRESLSHITIVGWLKEADGTFCKQRKGFQDIVLNLTTWRPNGRHGNS